VSAVWCIAPGQQLAAWGWDDEFVLYNNLSGDTHLFDGDAVAVLMHLQHTASTLDGLVAAFSDGIDPDDAAALSETMTHLLSNLQNLFLVELCPLSVH
jgi:PqqD family protein of HPr-rel-A system